jgi:rare lipoprotein A
MSLLGVSTACAGVGPRQPATVYPDYPRPSADPTPVADQRTESTAAPSPPKTSSAKSADEKPASSPLRGEYESAKALRTLRGKATYYGDSLSGHKTANGERYDPKLFTAAHKTLRFGSIVRVTRRDTNKSTYVKINDRGPFGARDRIIDLSKAAARELEMLRAGVVEVTVEIVFEPREK